MVALDGDQVRALGDVEVAVVDLVLAP